MKSTNQGESQLNRLMVCFLNSVFINPQLILLIDKCRLKWRESYETWYVLTVHFSSRETEVLVMSLFYKNNLLNSFLFTLDRLKWPSPYCSCDHEEQTAIHILTSCSHVDEDLRDQASYLLSVGNEVSSLEDLGTPHLAILNCSRDPKFIEICSECVNNDELKLRRKICISTGPTHA